MNPEQPGAPSPAPQQNPYDFIMSAGPQPQKSKFSIPQGRSPLQRVLFLGIGLVILLVVFLMVISLFSGGGSDEKLTSLAQEQTELIRLSDLAKDERTVRLSTTSNLSSNISVSLATSRADILGFIKGKKPNDKTLALKKDSKAETQLKTAASNNKYDDVFVSLMQTKLNTYRNNLKQLFAESKAAKQKKALQDAYNGATILLNSTGTPVN